VQHALVARCVYVACEVHYDLHPFMPRTLFTHQQQVLSWARERRHAALMLEMRLGKTLTVIKRVQETDALRCLVVAPLSVLRGWAAELREEGEPCAFVSGTPTQRQAIAAVESSRRRWALISYESLRSSPEIAAMMWDAVILDESTRIKNPRAQITKTMLRMAPGIPHRFILSGLPAPESIMDYWTQMAFVHGGRWMGCKSFYDWRTRFFSPDDRGYEWLPNHGTTEQVIDALKKSAYVLSRKNAGLGETRLAQRLHVDMTKDQRDAYTLATASFRADINGEDVLTNSALVQFGWMLRIAGGFSPDGKRVLSHAKVNELMRLLTDTDLRSQPVVVWCHFIAEMKLIRDTLTSAGISCACIWGDADADERARVVDAFGSRHRVVVVQESIGRFGLNLSAADAAVYYSRGYSHETRAQSEDRIVHLTKKRPLLFVDLLTAGTLDADVLDAVKFKKLSSSQVLRKVMGDVSRVGS